MRMMKKENKTMKLRRKMEEEFMNKLTVADVDDIPSLQYEFGSSLYRG